MQFGCTTFSMLLRSLDLPASVQHQRFSSIHKSSPMAPCETSVYQRHSSESRQVVGHPVTFHLLILPVCIHTYYSFAVLFFAYDTVGKYLIFGHSERLSQQCTESMSHHGSHSMLRGFTPYYFFFF